jgi:hypothetical protein
VSLWRFFKAPLHTTELMISPKKTLDNVAFGFGMLMVMEFSNLNLFIALWDSCSTSN